jgi:DNA-binding CsgD family transcriptional regulator
LFGPIPVDRALGLAAAGRGDRAAAHVHLAEAEAAVRASGMRPELGLILLERAAIGGPGVDRENMLAEGLRVCGELGMQALGRGTTKRFVPPRLSRPDGLTSRELDVLRLVVEGRSSREIAQTLVLSEYTVARHLTHIFTKLGVENRAGAAAHALRHGLV